MSHFLFLVLFLLFAGGMLIGYVLPPFVFGYGWGMALLGWVCILFWFRFRGYHRFLFWGIIGLAMAIGTLGMTSGNLLATQPP